MPPVSGMNSGIASSSSGVKTALDHHNNVDDELDASCRDVLRHPLVAELLAENEALLAALHNSRAVAAERDAAIFHAFWSLEEQQRQRVCVREAERRGAVLHLLWRSLMEHTQLLEQDYSDVQREMSVLQRFMTLAQENLSVPASQELAQDVELFDVVRRVSMGTPTSQRFSGLKRRRENSADTARLSGSSCINIRSASSPPEKKTPSAAAQPKVHASSTNSPSPITVMRRTIDQGR